jgi:cytochrome c oxidase subunit 4
MGEHAAHGHAEPIHEEAHASNRTYVTVALILAIITVIEVVIYYLPAFRPLLVPTLIVLSLAKFLAVVGYFMHLKYDSKLFRFMFFAGLVLTLAVYLAMLAMFWTGIYWAPLAAG